MKEMFKVTLSLVIIFIVAGLIMAFVFTQTAPVVKIAKEREETAARKKMMPDADEIKEAGVWHTPEGKSGKYFECKKGGQPIGYLISTLGKGYSSYINILVSVSNDLKINAIKILGHGETPGLGDEIDQAYFQKRFEGKTLDKLVVEKIEGSEKIQAISGATISSRAVTKGVRDAVTELTAKYGGGAVSNAPQAEGHGTEHGTDPHAEQNKEVKK